MELNTIDVQHTHEVAEEALKFDNLCTQIPFLHCRSSHRAATALVGVSESVELVYEVEVVNQIPDRPAAAVEGPEDQAAVSEGAAPRYRDPNNAYARRLAVAAGELVCATLPDGSETRPEQGGLICRGMLF